MFFWNGFFLCGIELESKWAKSHFDVLGEVGFNSEQEEVNISGSVIKTDKALNILIYSLSFGISFFG